MAEPQYVTHTDPDGHRDPDPRGGGHHDRLAAQPGGELPVQPRPRRHRADRGRRGTGPSRAGVVERPGEQGGADGPGHVRQRRGRHRVTVHRRDEPAHSDGPSRIQSDCGLDLDVQRRLQQRLRRDDQPDQPVPGRQHGLADRCARLPHASDRGVPGRVDLRRGHGVQQARHGLQGTGHGRSLRRPPSADQRGCHRQEPGDERTSRSEAGAGHRLARVGGHVRRGQHRHHRHQLARRRQLGSLADERGHRGHQSGNKRADAAVARGQRADQHREHQAHADPPHDPGPVAVRRPGNVEDGQSPERCGGAERGPAGRNTGSQRQHDRQRSAQPDSDPVRGCDAHRTSGVAHVPGHPAE